ncbi:CoA ester lyase [Streptomyces sp. KL116D]|uniref:HpcH/HpaI aldolase/citrate lyase family protein n=1 Tax=Streptomyces sp. KL116D TaxID=3045152 RepID=UPI003558FFC2
MTVSRSRIETACSLLFVPGDRPDRFTKAAASGADLIIIDLEDAVAEPDKHDARENAAEWLAKGADALIRINPPGTPESDRDAEMAARWAAPVMVPKSEDPAALSDLVCRSGGRSLLVPLIETAVGVERAMEVCATVGAVRAAFGNVDLAGHLGVAHDDHLALAYARSKLVCASAAAGMCPPVDGVSTGVRDTAALTADLVHARRLGFTGKLCIHPAQVASVAAHFAPSEAEVAWARSVLAVGESVTVVDGHMVDKPMLERARRIRDVVLRSAEG